MPEGLVIIYILPAREVQEAVPRQRHQDSRRPCFSLVNKFTPSAGHRTTKTRYRTRRLLLVIKWCVPQFLAWFSCSLLPARYSYSAFLHASLMFLNTVFLIRYNSRYFMKRFLSFSSHYQSDIIKSNHVVYVVNGQCYRVETRAAAFWT